MKYFGTDGIRGLGNSEVTAEIAYRIGRFLGNSKKKKRKIVIGSDSRISGTILEFSLASGILSSGGDVVSVGVIPTPAVSYLTRDLEADFGVMISASHNPVVDNGIKIFDRSGVKISDEVQLAIEEYIDGKDHGLYPVGAKIGRYEYNSNAQKLYVNHLLSIINPSCEEYKIVVDMANGATSEVGKYMFDLLDAEIIPINYEPNGLNINDKCGSTHTDSLHVAIQSHRADFGIAFDGDGDRIICLDAYGREFDGDYIIYLLANYFREKDKLKKNKVVLTKMSNLAIINALKNDFGLDVTICDVGDRYVSQALIEEDLNLGGESSGHIILRDYAASGDGMLTSLFIIGALKTLHVKLANIIDDVTKYPSYLVNVRVEDKKRALEDEQVKIEIKRINNILGTKGRVLVRASGTENLIRVLVECEEEKEALEYSKAICDAIKAVK